MFNIFKKVKKEKIFSPMTGEIIDITKVPDKVFSQKILGEGIAINPTEKNVVAPCNGKVVQVFATKHAIIIKSEKGLNLLIHAGIDTVELKGKGFEVFVQEGEKVKVGDKLMEIDLDYISKNDKSSITPIVLADMDQVKEVKKEGGEVVGGKDLLMEVTLN